MRPRTYGSINIKRRRVDEMSGLRLHEKGRKNRGKKSLMDSFTERGEHGTSDHILAGFI